MMDELRQEDSVWGTEFGTMSHGTYDCICECGYDPRGGCNRAVRYLTDDEVKVQIFENQRREREEMAAYLRELSMSGITIRKISAREFDSSRRVVLSDNELRPITQSELDKMIREARGYIRVNEGLVILGGGAGREWDVNNYLVEFNAPRLGHCLVCGGRGSVEFVLQSTQEWGECPCPECGGQL